MFHRAAPVYLYLCLYFNLQDGSDDGQEVADDDQHVPAVQKLFLVVLTHFTIMILQQEPGEPLKIHHSQRIFFFFYRRERNQMDTKYTFESKNSCRVMWCGVISWPGAAWWPVSWSECTAWLTWGRRGWRSSRTPGTSACSSQLEHR